jgi:hypothetical protein
MHVSKHSNRALRVFHCLKSLLRTEKPVSAGYLPLVFQFFLSPKSLQVARFSLGRCSSSHVALLLSSVFQRKKKAQV